MTRSNTGNQESVKHRHRLLESCVTRKCHAQFGGGQTEKERQRHLAGWLPYFSDHSHGFRPRRGCHTALGEIVHKWVGTTWFVEGDICACFDSLDHTVLMTILRERLHDNRFLRLIETLLQAGYLEEWRYCKFHRRIQHFSSGEGSRFQALHTRRKEPPTRVKRQARGPGDVLLRRYNPC